MKKKVDSRPTHSSVSNHTPAVKRPPNCSPRSIELPVAGAETDMMLNGAKVVVTISWTGAPVAETTLFSVLK